MVFADKDKSLSVVTSLPRSAINPYALADAIRAVVEATKGMQGLCEPFAAESVYKSMYSARNDFQRSAQRFPPLTSDEHIEYVNTYQTLIKQIDDLNKTGKAKSLAKAKAKELEQQANRILEHICVSCWKLTYIIVRELAEQRFGKKILDELLPDLLAEANTAMMRAVRNFDRQNKHLSFTIVQVEQCATMYEQYLIRKDTCALHLVGIELNAWWSRMNRNLL